MLNMLEFSKRRKRLLQQVGPRGIVILNAAPLVQRNGDAAYAYRQNSDFFYLTGFTEPAAVAVLLPKRQAGEFILFNRPRDKEHEIWDGARAGQDGACEYYGADQAFPISALEQMLPELLAERDTLHYTIGLDRPFDELILTALNKVRGKIRAGHKAPVNFVDITESLHELRLIKSPAEIAIMRRAADISAQAHARAMRYCQPGMYEYELEAEVLHEMQRQGARFAAYTSIVGSGANSCTLHYIANDQVIQKDDLVLVDAGGELNHYAADITRTFPASGRFSSAQRAVYEIVLAAQLAGIKAVKVGALWPTIQAAIIKVITEGLVELGILKGLVSQLIEQKAYLPYYMHNSGHWLGLDVHDVGRYKVGDKWRALAPGMVLTVEPGLYFAATLKGLNKRWHNIGVRIEDDILVATSGPDILSAAVPKEVQAIESLMA